MTALASLSPAAAVLPALDLGAGSHDVVDDRHRVAIDVVDVVNGAHPRDVDALVEVHAQAFPGYAFAINQIEADADVAPVRSSLIVHQWLVIHGGRPAGSVLFDTNLVRRAAIVHFIAIARAGRGVRVAGQPLSSWLCRRVMATLCRELDEHAPRTSPLGVFGESSARLVRRWRGVGFRPVDVPYAEPVAGPGWREVDGGKRPAMRPLRLLWLRSPGISIDDAATAGAAGAAAYLVDHYRLPLDHPIVVAATGLERTRPGAHRWPRRFTNKETS